MPKVAGSAILAVVNTRAGENRGASERIVSDLACVRGELTHADADQGDQGIAEHQAKK
jgi:hypothetical protein